MPLQEAINAYRAEKSDKLEKRASELFARLVKSSDAARAFERIVRKDGRRAADVLAICIETDDLLQTFPERIAKAEKALALAEKLEKAVEVLHESIGEVDERAVPLLSDLQSLSIFEPPANIPAVKDALDLIARRIDWGRGVAELTIAQIGGSRNSRNKEAAEIAAIWFLAARVRGLIGKPHILEVCCLAEIILGTKVSEDRLQHILDKRRKLYAKMIVIQTRRYLGNKTAAARRY